jgi:hypothetical protein
VTYNISISTSRVMQPNRKPLTNALKRERLGFHGLTIIVYPKNASPKGASGTAVVKRHLKPQ